MTFLSVYPLTADRFWREALARMRLVRKVFWDGYEKDIISIEVCVFALRGDIPSFFTAGYGVGVVV